MSAPLVSILIPCHNAARWLAATLESALAQTWPDKEIIVVDDGSTDDSLAVARGFEVRGVRVISQPNRGAAAARNTALRAAHGDFFQFLDADDLLHPEKIARQMERLAAAPPDTAATGRWGRFTGDPAQTSFPEKNPLFADLDPRAWLLAYASHDCMMHPAAWLVPRGLADAAGLWDERLSLNDDGEYFARVVCAAGRILWCENAFTHYRSGLAGSLSGARSRRHLESAHLALELITSRLLRFEDSPAFRAAAADLCQRFAYDYYPAAPDLVTAAERRARELGGARVQPLGGRGFRLLRRLIGWKAARRLQAIAGKFPSASGS